MADDTQAGSAEAKRGGSKKFAILIVAALMLGEGAAIYFVTSSLSGTPTPADAAEGEGGPGGAVVSEEDFVEVELGQARPTNRSTGKTVTISCQVSVLVEPGVTDLVEKVIEAKRARLFDRINFVFRSADLRQLDEPNLTTIKRRLRQELNTLFGEEEPIKDVAISEFMQSGSGV